LPEALQQKIIGRRAIHTGKPYGKADAPSLKSQSSAAIKMTRGDPTADHETFHPLIRQHPESGQRALFVNPIYTTRIEGFTAEDSAPLLTQLYHHATRPDICCRWRWQAGDVVIWDNRATLHYAVNDYDGYRRLLYRTTFSDHRAPY
jgi:taurine dioxygenase